MPRPRTAGIHIHLDPRIARAEEGADQHAQQRRAVSLPLLGRFADLDADACGSAALIAVMHFAGALRSARRADARLPRQLPGDDGRRVS